MSNFNTKSLVSLMTHNLLGLLSLFSSGLPSLGLLPPAQSLCASHLPSGKTAPGSSETSCHFRHHCLFTFALDLSELQVPTLMSQKFVTK